MESRRKQSKRDKIEGFEIGHGLNAVCIKDGYLYRPTHWLDKHDGDFPVENSFNQQMQESLDVANELSKSGYMTIDQCRESINLTKPEKIHWFKRFIRKIV